MTADCPNQVHVLYIYYIYISNRSKPWSNTVTDIHEGAAAHIDNLQLKVLPYLCDLF